MGAVLCFGWVEVGIGVHGSIFGGNLLVCAVVLAVIDFLLEHDLVAKVGERGDYFLCCFIGELFIWVRDVW